METQPPAMGETRYYVMCRVCGDGTIPAGSYRTEAERDAWQERHRRETGHDDWMTIDRADDEADDED